MPYAELPHWPASRVIGHAGGWSSARSAAARSRRSPAAVTSTKGTTSATVTFAVARRSALLGVKTLILTNAAGGINTGFSQGALMVIDDHINLMGSNPLVGAERRALRPALSRHDRGLLAAAARGSPTRRRRRRASRCRTASTSALLGPSYETPAEIRLSADDRRRRRRHVDRARSDRRAAHGHRGARHLVHHQHGRRRAAAAARSRRGDGDRAARARPVHRAAGGHHWPASDGRRLSVALVEVADGREAEFRASRASSRR